MKEFESLICDLERAAFFNGQSSDEPGELDNAHHELLRRYELTQRARARNLVERIQWWADYRIHRADLSEKNYEARYALARRIAAKYLEGKS